MERNATKTGLRLALIFKFLRFCLLNRFLLQFEVPGSKFIGVTFASVNIRAEGYRSEFEGDYGRFRAELRSKGRENDIKIKKPHARPLPANGAFSFDDSRLPAALSGSG